MVQAARPPKTKQSSAGFYRSCSRSALLDPVGKNTTKEGDGIEHNDMNDADAKEKKYFSEPRTLDVCCGRGKGSFRQPGNIIFQDVIQKHLNRYVQADSRTSKSAVVSSIVNSLLIDHNLRFIKKDPTVGKWYVLSSSLSHEKTGHAIRDQLTRMRKKPSSSTPTTISCSSSSLSSTDTKKKIVARKGTKVVYRKAKHRIQKKIEKTSIAQYQEVPVEKDEPDLLSFHLVAPEEEDDPWSNQFSYTDTVDPLSSSWRGVLGTDILVPTPPLGRDLCHLDFHQCNESLAQDLMDQHPRLQPQQGTLPMGPPTIPLHLRHHMVFVGDVRHLSAVTHLPTGMMPADRSTSLPQVSPESHRKLYVLPSALLRYQGLIVDEEDPFEPIHTQFVHPIWQRAACHTSDFTWPSQT